jgi:hypothetical protein
MMHVPRARWGARAIMAHVAGRPAAAEYRPETGLAISWECESCELMKSEPF